jgi:aspartate/methionine/tyrosine aminotransferase
VHQYNTVCVTTFAQAGAVEAYNGDQADAAMMRERFRQRRDLIIQGFARLPGLELHPPAGAFYAFPRILPTAGESDDGAFCGRLLEEEGVATVPGRSFGEAGKQHLRISYAASDQTIREALQRLERFVTRLPTSGGARQP